MPEIHIHTAQHIFTGEQWLENHSIICEGEIITDIVPADIRSNAAIHHTILPAFIDLQLYGAYGKLFSVFPEAETLQLIHDYCKQGGAYWFQPTVATNTNEVIYRCIDAVKDYRNNGGKGCLGLHIEGPWISKAKKGAHIESLIHSPSVAEARALLEYGKGIISMITLAPEVCSDEVIELIQSYGVVIAAGHSNCTFQEANAAFEKNIAVVTHLYNAMSGLQHREPGLVGATILHQQVMAGIIADGHHVNFAAINIALRLMKGRLFLVTDAVTDTDTGAYPHVKSGDKYEAGGILSGSALTMMQAVKNMIHHAGADVTEAIRMACVYPAKAMGLNDRIGRIEKGLEARFVMCEGEW